MIVHDWRQDGRLERLLQGLRRRQLRLVATNGCFDLTGAHHVRMLSFAAGLGDFLLVAVNADRTVRDLKGPGRPVVPLEDRLAVLSSLREVDCVVVFDEPTPAELWHLVRPSVLCRGGNPPPTFDESRWVGEVVICPPQPGRSTTELLQAWRAGCETDLCGRPAAPGGRPA